MLASKDKNTYTMPGTKHPSADGGLTHLVFYDQELDPRRVEHHPHRPADRLRRQVPPELRAHRARGAVRPRHAPPDHAELRALLDGARLEDVGDALAQIEVDRRRLLDAHRGTPVGPLVVFRPFPLKMGPSSTARRPRRLRSPQKPGGPGVSSTLSATPMSV